MAISERRRELKRRRQRREKRSRCRLKPKVGGRRATDPRSEQQPAGKDEEETVDSDEG